MKTPIIEPTRPPKPPEGLVAATTQLAIAREATRKAEARIAEINAKREQLFALDREIETAQFALTAAESIHERHVASVRVLPDEILALFGKNARESGALDPHGLLTQSHYGALIGAERAVADWPRIEAHYRQAVEVKQAERTAAEREVAELLDGAERPHVRVPDREFESGSQLFPAPKPDPDR